MRRLTILAVMLGGLLLSAQISLAQTSSPILAPIGAQFVNEGARLDIRVTASDPDVGDVITLFAESLPANAVFQDSTNGVGGLTFLPDYTQAGIFQVRIIASDQGGLADTELVDITVTNIDRAPVIAAISPQSVDEGGQLIVRVTSSDPDGDAITLAAQQLPANSSFHDSTGGVGGFLFDPNFSQAGPYQVRIIAQSNALVDTEFISITVTNIDRKPVLATITPQTVAEGGHLGVRATATDPDGDPITLIAQQLPANASFQDSTGGVGGLLFDPNFTQAGGYSVRLIASSLSLSDTQLVSITVTNIDRKPVLAVITPQTVAEGGHLGVRATATDPDGDPITLIAQQLPANASFQDSTGGVGGLLFDPNYTQAGGYSVRLIASSLSLPDTQLVSITVTNVDRKPVLATITPQTVAEGGHLGVRATATDPDGDPITLIAQQLPANASFQDSTGGVGGLIFDPNYTQAGGYSVRLIASSNSLADTQLVSITVTNVDRAPVLATIGPRSVAEGGLLQIRVTATDPDGDAVTLLTEQIPANASFHDSTGGVGGFIFNPDYTQAGSYPVRFIASSAGLTDTELVTITVNDLDRPPVITPVSSQTIPEGGHLALRITASDPDAGNIITLLAQNLPTNATFHDSTGGIGGLIFDPNYTQAASYVIRIIANSNALSDTELVFVTVTNTDRKPILSPISAQNLSEGGHLALRVTASDPDGDLITLLAQQLPANSSFHDSTGGAGGFLFDPDYSQAGSYQVRFIANSNLLADTQLVSIIVNNVDRPPAITPITAQNVPEAGLLAVRVASTDPDGDPITLIAENLPANASFHDSTGGFGGLIFNPDYTQAGPYQVRIIATSNALADTELVNITVTNVDRAPIFVDLGPQSVSEGQTLTVNMSSSDPDNDPITLTSGTLPAHATFTDLGGGAGRLIFNPDLTQEGLYNLSFYATSNSPALRDTLLLSVDVLHTNAAPVLAPIGPKTVNENQRLSFNIAASDLDGQIPILTALNLPPHAVFTDSLNGRGHFVFDPDFFQSGLYTVLFIAGDGALSDSEYVDITVVNVNRAPVLNPIGNRSVIEGNIISFRITSSDLDLQIPTLIAQNLPINASLVDSANGSGLFRFAPGYTQSGNYDIRFIASDGSLSDSELVRITVLEAGNQPPAIDSIAPQTLHEGEHLIMGIIARDPDSTISALQAFNLPQNSAFADSGNGRGSFTFNPGFLQAGSYSVLFRAFDGQYYDSLWVPITVLNAPLMPVLNPIGPKVVTEAATLQFVVTSSDPDGSIPQVSASPLPLHATFADSLNGHGLFRFTPDYTQSGSYTILFIASIGSLADSEYVQVTVNDAGNQPPVLSSIGPKSVYENDSLLFSISAIDPDGNDPILTAISLPQNASFIDNGNGTGGFTFYPNYIQSGIYQVLFIATDGALADSETVPVTVLNVNRTPVLVDIGPQSVSEGGLLEFAVRSYDLDGTIPMLSASPLPLNATFEDSTTGAGLFHFQPDYSQAGDYYILFSAYDGSSIDSERVHITVLSNNQPPIFQPLANQFVNEGGTLAFSVIASDPDGQSLVLTTSSLPLNASFTDNHNGTGAFYFQPDFTQSGVRIVDFFASDGQSSDTLSIEITIFEAGNQRPILAFIGPQTTNEGQTLQLHITSTDPDGNEPMMGASHLPLNAYFEDLGNGTAIFTFTPDFDQAGVDTVLFYATDGMMADSERVLITVVNVNRPPILNPIGPYTLTEGDSLALSISGSDPDGDSISFRAVPLAPHMVLVDNGHGTANFGFKPGYTQGGVYNVIFITSETSLADSEIVQFTVLEAGNQPPDLAAIDTAYYVTEGESLHVSISAVDPDGNPLALSATPLIANMTFVDNNNGTGNFTFRPNFQQSGSYILKFLAYDGQAYDSASTRIYVAEQGNQYPILAPIGPRTVAEGDSLVINVSATDPEGFIPFLYIDNPPPISNFVDLRNGTGRLIYHPNYYAAGTHVVRFIAMDNGGLTDYEDVTITVTDVNRSPWIVFRGPTTVTEGASIVDTVTAYDSTDFQPGTLSLAHGYMPPNATFTVIGNGIARFTFQPNYNQAGVDSAFFVAVDSDTPPLSASKWVYFRVLNSNRRPQLQQVPPSEINQGDSLTLNLLAIDPDGDPVTLFINTSNYPPIPVNSTFEDLGGGIGRFRFHPDYTQSGIYVVNFAATDGYLTDTKPGLIQVHDLGNQPPTLNPIGPYTLTEGDSIRIHVVSTDPDSTASTLSVDGLIPGMVFSDSTNGRGVFRYTALYNHAGVHHLMFRASDGQMADSEDVTITVLEAGNQRPHLGMISNRTIAEGTTLRFGVIASDADSVNPILSVHNLPLNASFVDSSNSRGSFTFTPSYTQAGIYTVTFLATDGQYPDVIDSENVAITVTDVNRVPTIDSLGPFSVNEGANLAFAVVSHDEDFTIPRLTVGHIPPNSTFLDNGDGTGYFSFNPDYFQSGVDSARFYAIDAADPNLFRLRTVRINIINVNRPPVLAPIPADTSIGDGFMLTINVSATDPDLNYPIIFQRGKPDSASFIDNNNGTGRFQWRPRYADIGTYHFYLGCRDRTNPAISDSQFVTLHVISAGNHPPIFVRIPDQRLKAGIDTLNLNITASDFDGDPLTINHIGDLPFGMTFIDHGNGTAAIYWVPLAAQRGDTLVSLVAQDPLGLTDSMTIHFSVITYIRGDANNSGDVNGLDVVFLVRYFKGGQRPPIMEAADANGNGTVNGLDVVYLINYFKGYGPPPPLNVGDPGGIDPVPINKLRHSSGNIKVD